MAANSIVGEGSKTMPADREHGQRQGLTRRDFLTQGAQAVVAAGLGPGLVSALVAGCGRPSEHQPGLRSDLVRGSIRVALDADVETLDPVMHRSRTVEAVVRNICDGLVARDANMDYVPQLAESWEVEGETRWIFKLREGVTFHNGDAFTAEDVKFTIDRVTGNIPGLAPSPRKDLLGPIVAAEVLDPHTVAITTDGPYPILQKKLVFQEICPKAYFEEVGPDEFARHPVGTGPFQLVEWVPGERIVVERYEDYYGGSPDIPPVDTAPLAGTIFRPLEEAATRLVSLEAGELDVMVSVPPDQADRVDALPRAHLSVAQGTRTHFVGLNCTRKPFSDLRVREAMRWAIDPSPIIEQFLLGRAQALPGILVPMAFGYADSLPAPKQDLQQARSLLRQAGYADGLSVTFDCESTDKRIAEAISGLLVGAGIQAEVRVWKKENLLNQLRRRERDMFLTSWGNSSLDPSGILPVLFSSGGYSNFFGFDNPEVDRLLSEADGAMDPDTRAAKYRRVQQLLHDQVPTCFHFAMQELYGVADRVRGFDARPDGMLPMHDVSLVER
ncbi:MAG: twin-arginine translocation signal domain-containing protein [Armatimonadetes bacterium]|nr:twin-arginine translocation signal domain-containing protein [Armatimonadota bacterium]